MGADHRDLATRAIDRGLRRLGALRRRPPAFDVHRLLLTARRDARLDDFGEPSFREGLDRLVAALDDEAGLTPLGRRAWRRTLTTVLARRLEVRDLTKRSTADPEPAQVRPIVVVGPHAGRVGSRMADDTPADLVGDPVDGDGDLLAVSFASLRYSRAAGVFGYDRWLLGADLAPAYRLHRLQLERRVPDRPSPRRPVLTATDHLWNLDVVHRTYPDSTLVVVDGGVLDTSSAAVDELAASWARTSDRVDRGLAAQWWTERARIGAARVARHRNLWPPAAVTDVALP